LAEKGLGNLAMRRARKCAVKGPKHETEALAPLLGWEQSDGELSLGTKNIETFERPHAVFRMPHGPNSVGAEPNRAQDICAGHDELELPIGISQQDMLAPIGGLQDRSTILQRSEIEPSHQ
jgi:hypothetical protein